MWFQIPSVALAFLAVATSAGNPLEEQIRQQRGLEAEADMINFDSLLSPSMSSCGCKSAKRPCLFIHGENNKVEMKELQDSSKLFGDMSAHAPCCSSIKYASLDTESNAWTDETLQETVCSHALSMSDTSSVKKGVIKDTILVTHSMGALIVAGAVANKKCSIDSSTSWASMSAPMNGTMASNFMQDVCSNDDTKPFQSVLAIMGKCPVNAGIQSIAYQGGKYSTAELEDAYIAAQEVYRDHVSGVMCSNSNVGIMSLDQAKYMTLTSQISHGTTEHDGFVTYESCRGGIPVGDFSTDPTNKFYVTKLNHADTAFLHGDGYFTNERAPMRWFSCRF